MKPNSLVINKIHYNQKLRSAKDNENVFERTLYKESFAIPRYSEIFGSVIKSLKSV